MRVIIDAKGSYFDNKKTVYTIILEGHSKNERVCNMVSAIALFMSLHNEVDVKEYPGNKFMFLFKQDMAKLFYWFIDFLEYVRDNEENSDIQWEELRYEKIR